MFLRRLRYRIVEWVCLQSVGRARLLSKRVYVLYSHAHIDLLLHQILNGRTQRASMSFMLLLIIYLPTVLYG